MSIKQCMLFSKTVEYAIQAMVALACEEPGTSLDVRKLAKRTGAPHYYLSKIMNQLQAAGLLDSTKGRQGGFKLAKPHKDIDFLQIFEAIEPVRVNKSERCIFEKKSCDHADLCLLHEFWENVSRVFIRTAKKHTLAYIRKKKKNVSLQDT